MVGLKIALGKEERKGSLRSCLLHNSNLPTLHVVHPPEIARDCALATPCAASARVDISGLCCRELFWESPLLTAQHSTAQLGGGRTCGAWEPPVPGTRARGAWGAPRSARLAACRHCKHASTRVCSPPGCQPLQLFVTACLILCF